MRNWNGHLLIYLTISAFYSRFAAPLVFLSSWTSVTWVEDYTLRRRLYPRSQHGIYVLDTWDGIRLGAVAPASMAITASRTAPAQARRSYAQAIPIVIQFRFHRLKPKTSGPLRRARSSLSVVTHVLSLPPVGWRLRVDGINFLLKYFL